MSDPCVITGCGRAKPETSYLCDGHRNRLAGQLVEMPSLIEELEVTATKQDRTGPVGKRATGHARPLPFNEAAADLLTDVITVLSNIGAEVAIGRGYECPITTRYLCEWLSLQVDWMRGQPRAEEWCDLIEHYTHQIRDAIDNHTTRFMGYCSAIVESVTIDYTNDPTASVFTPVYRVYKCNEPLHAKGNQHTVTCKKCKTKYDTITLTRDGIERSANFTSDAENIAAILTAAGYPIKAARIRKWRERTSKRFTERALWFLSDNDEPPPPTERHPILTQGSGLYRLGDVLDRVRDESASRPGRKAKP